MKIDFKKIKKIAKEPMSLNQKISLLPSLDKFNKFFLYVYSKEKNKSLEIFPIKEILEDPKIVEEIIFEDVFKDILLEKLNVTPFFFVDYYKNKKNILNVFPNVLVTELDLQMERNLEIISSYLFRENLLKNYLTEIINRNNYFYSMYFNLVQPEEFSLGTQEIIKEHARQGHINPLKIINILNNQEIQSIFLNLFKKDDLLDFIMKINDNDFIYFKKLKIQTKYFLKKLIIEKLKNESYQVLKKIVFNKEFFVKNLKKFKIDEEYKFLVYSYEDKIAKDDLVHEIDFNNFELINLFLKNYTFSEIYEMIRDLDKFTNSEEIRRILLFEISQEMSVAQLVTLPNIFKRKDILKILISKLDKKIMISDLNTIKKFIKNNNQDKEFLIYLKNFEVLENNIIYFNLHYILNLKELKEIYSLKYILKNSHEQRLIVFFKSLNIIEKIEFWKLIKDELSSGNIRAYNFIELIRLEDYTSEVTDYSRFIKSLAVERKYYLVHFQEYINEDIPPWQYPHLFTLKYSEKSFYKMFNKTESLDKKGFFLKILFENNPKFINKETIPKLIKKEKTLELLIKNFMLIPKKDQKSIISKLLIEHKTNLDKFFRIPNINQILMKKDYKNILLNYNDKPYQGHKSIINLFKENQDFKDYFISKSKLITDIDVISFFIDDFSLSETEKINLLKKTSIKSKIVDFDIKIEDLSTKELVYILNNFRIRKNLYFEILSILDSKDWNEKWFSDEKSLEIYIQRFTLEKRIFDAVEKNPIIFNATKEYFYNQINEEEKKVFLKSLYKNLRARSYSSEEYNKIVLNILKYYPEKFIDLIKMFEKSSYPENIFKTIFTFHRKISNKLLLDIYKKTTFKQKKTYIKNFIKIDWNDIKDSNLFNLIFKGNYYKEEIQKFLDLDFWINDSFNIDLFRKEIDTLSAYQKNIFFVSFFKEIDSFVISKNNFYKIWQNIDEEIQKKIVSSIDFYKIIYILGNKNYHEFCQEILKKHKIDNFSFLLNFWESISYPEFVKLIDLNTDNFIVKDAIKILNKTKINFKNKDNVEKTKIYLSLLNKKLKKQINFNRLNDFWKKEYIEYIFEQNSYQIDKSGLFFEDGKDIVFCKKIYDTKYFMDSIEKEKDLFLNKNRMNYRLFEFDFGNKKINARSDFKINKVLKKKNIQSINISIRDIYQKDGLDNRYSEIFYSALNSISLKFEDSIKDISINYIKKTIDISLEGNIIFEELYEIYSLIESFNFFCQQEFFSKLQDLYSSMDNSIKLNYVNHFREENNNLKTIEKYQEAYYYSEFLKLKKNDITFQSSKECVKNNFKDFLIFLNLQYSKNKKIISLEKGYKKLEIYQVLYKDRGLRNYKLILNKEDILRLLDSFNVDLATVDESFLEKNEFIYKINNLYYIK